jgi:hypothetical protein
VYPDGQISEVAGSIDRTTRPTINSVLQILKVKVKVTLDQAMKAQRGSRGKL